MTRLRAGTCLLVFGILSAPELVAQSPIVNQLTINQWVQAADDGSIQGRVVLPAGRGQVKALKNVRVAVSGRGGKVIRTRSNSRGEFAIGNIEPGIYAVTARGSDVFACCAMHVVNRQAGQGKFPNVLEIPVASVDDTVVKGAFIRYLPPKATGTHRAASDDELKGLANQVRGSESIQVAMYAGGLQGRILLAGVSEAGLQGAAMTNVFIFENGAEVGRAVTDRDGRFRIQKIFPGQYSLLTVGPGGIGLLGFELVGQRDGQRLGQSGSPNGQRLVQVQADVPAVLALQVAPMPEVVDAVELVLQSDGDDSDGEDSDGEDSDEEDSDGEDSDGEDSDREDGSVAISPDVGEIPLPEGQPASPEGFGTPVPGAGFAQGNASAGASFGGGGGGGAVGGGGGGGAALAGLAAAAAAAGNSGSGGIFVAPASPASPVFGIGP